MARLWRLSVVVIVLTLSLLAVFAPNTGVDGGTALDRRSR
jgi:hypothetical protein